MASLQGVRGSARLRDLRRSGLADREGRGDRLAELGGDLRQQLGGEDARVNVIVWLVALLVILIGSRELLLSGVPHAGELLAWPAGPFVLVREYLGGWWSQGLGGTRPVPTGMGLSAVLGLITFGANGLPRTLLVVGPLFAGALGLWRLARAIAPSRAAAAALVVYVAVPLAANAVGTGSLSGLLVYGALPWTLHGLARVHAAPPFVRPADPARARRLVCADVVVLGVLAAADLFPHLLGRCGNWTEFLSDIKDVLVRWWGRKDSNLRSHKAADLQSAPFATRDTPPSNSVATTRPKWRRTGHEMTLNTAATRSGSAVGRVYGEATTAKSTKASR